MKGIQLKFASHVLGISAMIFISHTSLGADPTRVNRYSLHQLTADPSQVDLLSAVIDTRLPAYVETVGTAVDYILHRSGYRHVATDEILRTLDLPLPESHRTIGPLDVRTAVQTIVGDPWQMQEDHTRRILWFQRAGADLPNSGTPSSEPKPAPEIMPSPATMGARHSDSQTWQLHKSRTLRENLKDWTTKVDWSLEWRSQHDYAITHPANFSGDLMQAVGALLLHYERAPIPLVAKFYAGNSVLVIEPSDDSTSTKLP